MSTDKSRVHMITQVGNHLVRWATAQPFWSKQDQLWSHIRLLRLFSRLVLQNSRNLHSVGLHSPCGQPVPVLDCLQRKRFFLKYSQNLSVSAFNLRRCVSSIQNKIEEITNLLTEIEGNSYDYVQLIKHNNKVPVSSAFHSLQFVIKVCISHKLK